MGKNARSAAPSAKPKPAAVKKAAPKKAAAKSKAAAKPAKARYKYSFQDPNLGLEARVSNLLGLMTVEEKIKCFSTVPDIPRLHVVGTGHVEGLHGLALGEPGGWGQGYPVTTTQFPQAYGMGETWDAEMVRKMGEVEGIETRFAWECQRYKRGGLVVRAPNADLGRDPRWGRTEECFGEDPYLVGTLATAMTKGLQGEDPRYLRTASLLKHFLANSNEDGRSHTSSDFDERLFHEYYSVPFRMAIEEGRANGYMAAYNSMNGVPMHVNPVLKEITQKIWGHDGIICTDGGGLGLLVSDHKYSSTLPEGVAATVKAGINQYLDKHANAMREAVKNGLLSEAEMDEALRGVFRVMARLGQLDPVEKVPYRQVDEDAPNPWDSKKTHELVLEATRKSVVLLKNEGGALPVKKEGLRSVALIGRWADSVELDWYSGSPPYHITPLEGLRSKLGPKVKVEHAKDNKDGAAVALAKSCDLVILCAGNHPTGNMGWGKIEDPAEGKEAFDRQNINLREDALLKELAAANPNTVLVLVSSFPVDISWAQANLKAIVHMTHNSQEMGSALADVLLGNYNPGGRLTQTWPKSLDQLPPMMDYDIRHGRTYMYFKQEPLYPFGFGLSYTSFEYSGLGLSAPSLGSKAGVKVSFELRNSGQADGEEVAQLYVRHLNSAVERPLMELKGFKRVALKKGERKKVEFELKARDLAYWEAAKKGWKIEEGKVQIMVGASSADIRQEAVLPVQP